MNLKIGELAARTGCLPETIRYYEQRGLLSAPARSSGNYRLYGAAHLDRLTIIRRCRGLDTAAGCIHCRPVSAILAQEISVRIAVCVLATR